MAMENKVSHVIEFNSKNSTYNKIVETDIANGSETLIWKKENVRELIILDKVRYLSPQEWACLLSQLNAIVEYNNSVSDPEEMVSVEGGLVTIFDIFPNDYKNASGNFLPGGTFFYRQKINENKYTFGYSGIIWRVGNPNIPKSYIELKSKDFSATNTVSLGRFGSTKKEAPEKETPRLEPKKEIPKEPLDSGANLDLRRAYSQMGIKF
jgi:hypothetical protein